MSEKWRLFIAIELPQTVLSELADLQAALRARTPDRVLRWTRPEGIHLTLKFLGDVPTGDLAAIQAALTDAAANHAPFNLVVEGVGCFPNTQRPRVVWAGVGGDTRTLAQVQAAVEQHVAPLGYPTEKRPFNPHLTLARMQRSADRAALEAVGRTVEGWQARSRIASWEVQAISLMRSQLRPDGAVYTEVQRAPLAAPDA